LSIGAFVQNWTSFGGSGNRPDTNQMNLQPFAAYFLPNGWSIGYSGNILANWEADGGNVWTVPLGLQVAKVVKFGPLPVRLQLGGQYMVHHPDVGGQEWNIQLMVVPVIPKLIKATFLVSEQRVVMSDKCRGKEKSVECRVKMKKKELLSVLVTDKSAGCPTFLLLSRGGELHSVLHTPYLTKLLWQGNNILHRPDGYLL
jgi:hypothetical protein